jgi:hypothetical protein
MSRTCEGLDFRHGALARLAVLILPLALGAAMAPSAEATASLGWSSPARLGEASTPTAVSCASESLCVAVDQEGDLLSTSDPTATEPGAKWSTAHEDPGQHFDAVSCAPGGPCVAVDGRGDAFVSVGPNATAWSKTTTSDTDELTGVSCPTASLCVAVDDTGEVRTTTNPASGVWVPGASTGHDLTGVSCSSQSLCVATDTSGEVLSSTSPTSTAPWSAHEVAFKELGLLAVSCSAAGPCVAVDELGDARASADPGALEPTWNLTPIDAGESLDAVSCASTGLCVAVGDAGKALASDDPGSSQPDWSSASPDSGPLAGVSCLPGGFCMAVDTAGYSLGGRVPAPSATTLQPTEVTATSATVSGVVDPNDAVLGACSFEYGTHIPYTHTAPCATVPVPIGGEQNVSAQLTELAPNATYHYRVMASSPRGTGIGADQTFATPTSAVVALAHPNPSISGTPAVGQVLTCHANLASGSSASLTYQWLRELIPIPGAIGSTYGVKGQDSGHHLQCEVTATDGGGSASARSAFVTIPVGGVPASAGETGVGAGIFENGKVIVPIVCSAQASSGCEVSLRLSAVETLSGRRVVAVAARSRHSAHARAAALRHLTVTLARIRVHLARGAHLSIAVSLDAAGKRLLKAVHRFSASLYVSGTVIASIEAQLSQQLIALTRSSHSASTHAARHR